MLLSHLTKAVQGEVHRSTLPSLTLVTGQLPLDVTCGAPVACGDAQLAHVVAIHGVVEAQTGRAAARHVTALYEQSEVNKHRSKADLSSIFIKCRLIIEHYLLAAPGNWFSSHTVTLVDP